MLVKVAQQRDLEEMGPGLCVYLLILVVMGAFAKKNVMDMDDRDMEELFQQWEVSGVVAVLVCKPHSFGRRMMMRHSLT